MLFRPNIKIYFLCHIGEKMPDSSMSTKSYLTPYMHFWKINIYQLMNWNQPFFPLAKNKTNGYDERNLNVMRNNFSNLLHLYKYLRFLWETVFSDKLKIVQVVPTLEKGDGDIWFENNKTDKLDITCDIPKGSILGPLMSIIYISDLVLLGSFRPNNVWRWY